MLIFFLIPKIIKFKSRMIIFIETPIIWKTDTQPRITTVKLLCLHRGFRKLTERQHSSRHLILSTKNRVTRKTRKSHINQKPSWFHRLIVLSHQEIHLIDTERYFENTCCTAGGQIGQIPVPLASTRNENSAYFDLVYPRDKRGVK